METAVKERLVGAVVLVGLIVALVPEMLSGPRRVPDQDGAADASVRTFTIDLAPAPNAGASSAPAARLEPQTAPAASKTGAEPENTASKEVPRPSATTDEPVERESAPPATTAQPPAASQTRPAADRGWAVQLGSFASRENAERLAAEVRRGGYRAFVSRFESGRSVRYRVRVGPEAERAQAEQVAQRLQRDGRQVSVVSHP